MCVTLVQQRNRFYHFIDWIEGPLPEIEPVRGIAKVAKNLSPLRARTWGKPITIIAKGA